MNEQDASRAAEPRPWWRTGWGIGGFFALVFLALLALRMPLEGWPIRDVDEAVSALIATSWLEGGVPYRDAIDQRGPVTYVLYALVFLVAGKNDMAAVHWALLLLIFGGCLLVFRVAAELGGTLLRRGGSGDGSSDTTEAEPADAPAEAGTGARRWLLDLPSGYLAAGLVAVCSFTYRRSQMLAFHTEWPVLILSTLGMWWVWRRLEEARRETVPEGRVVGGLFLAGLAFGGAFLSKQPAVFDGAAAGAFLLAWQWHWGRLFTRETVVRAGALAGGFFVALGVCVAYFAAEGALGDFYLYFWQYNVEHYTAVVPVADRIAALDPFLHKRHYLTANPLLLIAVLIAVARAIGALFDRGRRAIDGRLLLVLWFLAAYFGASYSGRNFGHYFIQILAPACLITALLVRELWLRAGRAPGFLGTWAWRGALATVVLVALGLSVYRFRGDLAVRRIGDTPRPGVQEKLVEYLETTTAPDDKIFVWGYNPEVYVLSNRRPATRYSNTNYLTGMLPWENHRRGVDTSEHIVPGAWDILFDELAAQPPAVIIDTSVGDHRSYGKYRVKKFPRLKRYLDAGYERVDTIRDRRGRRYYDIYRPR